ncbi:TetR/AcrR family transcriptional regulator [Prosthecodimorpha staleyi]|uniref:TetR family transcriptional regulator n=1 Tax=Prosthecodimorpha staleyi TaxID=2840188 RepID=A0A947D2E9_9HYPH|nr:TetR/AcrR family transcriptional regulator [Prosthecodimorpha staleyi]MBT9289074.1 TetR family transcriptional regulator [Prosthecodimorpha staleyi]
MTAHAIDEARQDTRTRILEEAERLFRHYGYTKTTVADIARELGMSPANVYRFFPSKAAINEAIADRMLSARVAHCRTIARGAGTPTERVRALLLANHHQTVEVFLDEKKVHEMVSVAIHEQWQVVRRFIQETTAVFAEVIAEGMATGEFAPGDPVRVARRTHQCFVTHIHPELVVQCLQDSDRAGPEEMADFILRALRP